LIKVGRAFSHFIYDNEKVVAAQFSNGEIEYGDIFIGADGANSIARKEIFGEICFTKVEVKEIVGSVHNEELYKRYNDVFTKFQKEDKGLSFGLIPTAENQFVWFIQYDAVLGNASNFSADELKTFCKDLTSEFPSLVTEVIEATNFSNSYIWNTRDFDLLPTFHKNNTVLVGDAAHVAVPFTSAGVTNAIIDAKKPQNSRKNSTRSGKFALTSAGQFDRRPLVSSSIGQTELRGMLSLWLVGTRCSSNQSK
jgi:2-polyprenyl-6-methoxyphenol hydroxylase-like FAD-dependent oxidoreductase